MADDIPLDAAAVVGPAEPSGDGPAPEPRAPEPEQKPKEEKPKRAPRPRKPKAREPAAEPAAEPRQLSQPPPALDPLFFAGLNTTLKRMMKEERVTKLSSLAIV